MSKVQYNSLKVLNDLINNGRSGIVKFILPDGPSDGIKGLADADTITLSYKNNFKPILPNIDKLTQLSNMININDGGTANSGGVGAYKDKMFSWTNSTQAAWTGSEPLKLTFSFYLFSFSEKDKIDEKFNYFRKLMFPQKLNDSEFSVKVHGGYKPDVLDNTSTNAIDNNINSSYTGTITLHIGSQCRLTGLLLEDITEERSTSQVEDGNPLFIKANISLRTRRVLFANEVEKLFKTVVG